MHPSDYQQEQNRLAQLYRNMHEGELENVAAEAYNLTDVAREALSFEISSRGLKIPLNLELPVDEDAEPLPPTDDGFVPDDDDIVSVYVAHEMDELMRVKDILDRERVECFLGEEKTRNPKDLSASFHGDVRVRVWLAQQRHAIELLNAAIPDYGKREGSDELEVRCPACKSDGVIFEERDVESTGGKLTNQSKFRWVCDDCGHEWEDDGVIS